MHKLKQLILRTDISGMPLEWIHYQTAAKLYQTEQVAYICGAEIFTLFAGINASTGLQSKLPIHSIIATQGTNHFLFENYIPPLNNRSLFSRDNRLCLYCGQQFADKSLSRDHIIPVSKGGRDCWTNVVTACKPCNNAKADKTPEAAHMPLLAIPFSPSYAEYVYLQGKNILADQMAFLRAHFPRKSPLRKRL